MYRFVAQVDLCHVVHTVSNFRIQQVMGDHGIEKAPLNPDAVISEFKDIILEVLTDLFDVSILKKRTEYFYLSLCFRPVCRDRHIESLSLFVCKR
ncbi:hypothetical protein SDC9_200466 [bioreactor metagenome]|uniref:Uncharacterized protein n=1 Tax=bioreactor metagenome TaxID=1076179 RepID=A0A645J026_9ZZZZ